MLGFGEVAVSRGLLDEAGVWFDRVLKLIHQNHPKAEALALTRVAHLWSEQRRPTALVLACWQRAARIYLDRAMEAEHRAAQEKIARLEGAPPPFGFVEPSRGESVSPETSGPDLAAPGHLHLEAGRYAEAEFEFRSVLRQDLCHLSALWGLARTCQALGKLRESLVCYHRLLSLGWANGALYQHLGEVYQHQDQPFDAVKSFLQAGELYIQAEQDAKAIRAFELALSTDPGNSAALEALRKLGDKT